MAIGGFLVIIFILLLTEKRKTAVIARRRAHAKQKGEKEMKALAEKFVGKDCLVYTMASSVESIKGVIREVTDGGLLIEDNGNLQAVNLEYVTRIREWPRNAKGKKKSVIV